MSEHEAYSDAFEAACRSCTVSAADHGPESNEDEPNFKEKGSGGNFGGRSESEGEEEDMPQHERE